MEIKNYKDYWPFLLSILLFLIMVGYYIHIYINWNSEFKNGESSVEVKLPVINWDEYLNLSKKYENGILGEDKNL